MRAGWRKNSPAMPCKAGQAGNTESRLPVSVANRNGIVFGDRFDFACSAHPSIDTAPFIEAGATWLLHAFRPGNTPDQVLRFISRFAER